MRDLELLQPLDEIKESQNHDTDDPGSYFGEITHLHTVR
jgi:hypothetical protein